MYSITGATAANTTETGMMNATNGARDAITTGAGAMGTTTGAGAAVMQELDRGKGWCDVLHHDTVHCHLVVLSVDPTVDRRVSVNSGAPQQCHDMCVPLASTKPRTAHKVELH